ncbi:KN motif and ankyrin repeat domain-containing protein 4-like [Colossoma macropomum]|uniref:KN motif and ankyrin repeat domain-containing protein 4-like n=1 Tax=Colossoma macropomum TaxID=42526 RepID=UPI0018652175|nr:KN motif and ankyrin repeat domain-containing protein 4-like [Colossoma macropomum]XP_036452186.1 KN motif and ankyrin repeat domain-containing protein 4-like [Colossoma macropomum]
MDTQKVNGVSPKENGSHRRPPCYSVETPYGFHLDLDFLKYVDDIEKGNTIRRVPIQRRQRGRSSGSLSRNLSLPGHGCRPSQWNSTGILFPKPRLADSHQRYEFQSTDSGSPGFIRQVEPSYSSFTAAEMDATIQAFDEQPLGLHVRPNLLRASSLPLTVLLRKRSESNEDPISPNGSRDYLTQENGSSEDVFHSPERKTGGVNGTLQRLTTALQRVGELEEEIRVIPDLKAQICILQEEREMLLHKFQFQNDSKGPLDISTSVPQSSNHSALPTQVLVNQNQNKANDDWMNREYDQLEENVKASSEQVDAIVIPLTSEKEVTGTGNLTKTVRENRDPLDHGDRSKSLTETLQRKVVMLEQKLHELESELDKTKDQLLEQVQESHMKDERIKDLTKQAEQVWVRTEKTAVHPINAMNGQGVQPSPESTSEKSEPSVQNQLQESSKGGQVCLEEGGKPHASRGPVRSHTEMEHHVKRVKELLHEQWECLCRKESSGRVLSSEHLPPRVCSIQEQLVTLVSLLSLYVSPAGEMPLPAQESKMVDQISVVNKSRTESPTRVDARGRSGEGKDEVESITSPKEHAEEEFDHKIFQREAEQASSILSNKDDPTHGGGVSEKIMKDLHLLEQTIGAQCPVKDEDKQGSSCSGAESEELLLEEGGREAKIDKDFMAACYFLEDHMNEVSDPNDEMRQALTVVFQQWFHVSAEEDSCADTVALYLNEVSTKTPSILPFLVNMVDDNGNTALHYSVSHSNFSIVKLLLDTEACEVNLRNKIGYTAIMLASLVPVDSPKDMKVIQQLMELGDVNACAGQVGQTALHLAVRHGRVSTVQQLLAQGANINAQDQAGTTALISACDRGHTDIVRILLEHPDCDVSLTDKGGRSALSLATQASHTEIADLLKDRAKIRGPDRCKMA